MKRFSKCFRRGEKGFTLIELLVVVAIFGVLAAVAIPSVARFIGTGEAEAAKTEIDNVQIAVVAAMADASPVCGTIISADPTCYIDDTGTDCYCNVSGDLPFGDYIVGGYTSLTYSYTVNVDGVVTQGEAL